MWLLIGTTGARGTEIETGPLMGVIAGGGTLVPLGGMFSILQLKKKQNIINFITNKIYKNHHIYLTVGMGINSR